MLIRGILVANEDQWGSQRRPQIVGCGNERSGVASFVAKTPSNCGLGE
jgi:hypothetical protein